MAIRKEGLYSTGLSPKLAFQAAEEALREMGAIIDEKHSNAIFAHTPNSLLGNPGDKIQVLVVSSDNKITNLKIISETPGMALFDAGANLDHINKIIQRLKDMSNWITNQDSTREDDFRQTNKSRGVNSDNPTLGNIFISYRRSDSADVAGRIYDRLIDKFGRDSIFKDVDSIPLGINFKQYLDKMVGECSVLLAVIGDNWLDATDALGKRRLDDPSDFVRIEIESALTRDIPVIPLIVRNAKMPHEEKLPHSLKNLVFRNGIPIRPDPDFHRDMDRLISALQKYDQ